MITQLSEKDFLKFIGEKNKLIIMDFFAEWCEPCQIMAPILEEVAKKYKNIKIGKVNVDDNSSLASEYRISGIPCIVFFKNGKEVGRIVGAMNKEALQRKIEECK